MSRYSVRPLKEQDIESIIAIDALVTGARGPDRAGFWRGLLSLHVPSEEVPAAEEPRGGCLCEVAELSGGKDGAAGQVVGFIIGDVQSWQFGIPRHGRIVTIGVHPDHRRHGVASLLAEALLGAFQKIGLPFVHCMVRPGDPLAEFFESIGCRASEFKVLEKRL